MSTIESILNNITADFNISKRSAEAVVFTGSEKTDDYNETFRAAITLSVSHDKERKAFTVFLDREAQSPTIHRRVIDFASDAPSIVRVFQQRRPVARYSEKALRAVFLETLRDFQEVLASDPSEAEALVSWADGILDK